MSFLFIFDPFDSDPWICILGGPDSSHCPEWEKFLFQRFRFIIFAFQGGALGAMLELFQCLVAANSPVLTYPDLLALLVNPVLGARGADIHKQGRANIAKCVASLVSSNKQQV